LMASNDWDFWWCVYSPFR